RKGADSGRNGRAKGHIEVPKTKTLKFNRITGHPAELEAIRKRNALSVRIDINGAEHGVEIGFAITVFIVEGAVVNGLAVPRDSAGGDIGGTYRTPFSLHLSKTDPPIIIGIGDGQGFKPYLPADHFDQSRAVHMRRISAFAAVFGNRRPGPAIAVG